MRERANVCEQYKIDSHEENKLSLWIPQSHSLCTVFIDGSVSVLCDRNQILVTVDFSRTTVIAYEYTRLHKLLCHKLDILFTRRK